MRFKSRSRALAASALAASLGLAGLGLVAPAAQAAPAETDRVAGTDRYDTAADIATASYPAADTVVLTTGEKLPDALSANPIAGANDAPILLTLTDSIPASTQAALDGIDPTNVIIVGGTSAVSAEVEAALEADGYTVTREAGVDRFETAAEVALEVGTAPDIDADGAGDQAAMATVALANGLTGLPDAVAASPMLHQMDIPLLLTGPDTLNEDAAAAIDALGAEQVLILGGTAAVSLNIEQELQDDGVNAERLAGNDRWGTATSIADFELDFLGFDAATTYIASGFSLADALAGGPLASVTNSPIVLVSETSVPAPTANWLEDRAAEAAEIVALGGTAVINDGVLTEASELADDQAGAGQVTLAANSVEQGGTVTGTATGDNVQSVTVSGCGVSSRSLNDENTTTEGYQFSFQIPANQPAGNCELTFTVTDSTGTVTETETITVTARPAGASTTSRPELQAASIVSTVPANQESPSNPRGTTIRYTFDEAVTGAQPTLANFFVIEYDGDRQAATSAVIDPNDTRSILARFANYQNTSSTAQTADISVATVDPGAVQDAGNATNPEGDAAIGSGSQTSTLSAGTTSAPDLQAVNNARAGQTAGTTAVDFIFDEAAFTTFGNGGAGFAIVFGNNTEAACTGPQPADTATTLPSGGTVAGGNGTTTLTVVCNGSFTTGDIARGTVAAGTVSDASNATALAGNDNPLQASNAPDLNTSGPDLVSATLTLGANATTPDTVLYTFDGSLTAAVNARNFRAYDANGTEYLGDTAQRSPDSTQVLITFNDANDDNTAGDLEDLARVVGASVIDAAVTSNTTGNPTNQQDEVGVTPQGNNVTTPAGRTDGPDLTGVALTRVNDAFGQQTDTVATYTFDEDVDPAATQANRLFLYRADGTRLICVDATLGPATRTEENDNTVQCNDYIVDANNNGVVDGGEVAPTEAQVLSAVLGTVQDGAVNDEEAGGDVNPEGAEATTGSTGTPTV